MKNTKLTLTDQTGYLIEAVHVRKAYHMEDGAILALKEVSLNIKQGEVVAIMGPSGCGKTTLLNCLSSLDSIDSGSIKIAGCDLRELNDDEITAFRARHMGFIFQTYNLLPVLSGLENVELPLLVGGMKPREARRRAMEAIEQVGLAAWAHHKPAEMSGGQRQRFTIARALATQPVIVWADEPTGALDSDTSKEIIDLMLQLNRQNHQTFVWVTHAPEIGAMAQRLIRMRDGMIVEERSITSVEETLNA